jgi:hypothetical protein
VHGASGLIARIYSYWQLGEKGEEFVGRLYAVDGDDRLGDLCSLRKISGRAEGSADLRATMRMQRFCL